ncbi:MAG: DUF4296 domain-containing protein [Bacteroidetes bacterium]|nr:DUF4296 domain-containing protein [Bacteroidota bacterium]
MRTRILIIVTLFALSCSHNEEKPSSAILSRDTMISILVDFQLVEGESLRRQQLEQNVPFYTNFYYEAILKKHSITRRQFRDNITYYKDHMEELESMYTQVLNRLSKMQNDAGIPVKPKAISPQKEK